MNRRYQVEIGASNLIRRETDTLAGLRRIAGRATNGARISVENDGEWVFLGSRGELLGAIRLAKEQGCELGQQV